MAFEVIVKNRFRQAKRKLVPRFEEQVKAVAFAIEGHAKAICPVDTGRLQNSIRAEPVGELEWIVAPHTDYAAFVEFGTRRMAPRPYLRPAAERVARSKRIRVKLGGK